MKGGKPVIFGKVVDAVMKVIEILCMILLAATVVIITCQVIWRYVLGAPLAWTEELSRYLFIWIVMLGIPIMFHRNIAISFDLFVSKLKGGKRDTVDVIFRLLGLFFCVVYFIFSMSLVMKTGARKTSGMEIPLNCLYTAQPVCAVLTGVIMIRQIIDILRKGGKEKC